MEKFAYVRDGAVCHLSTSDNEEMAGVIVVPATEGVEVNWLWDGSVFSAPTSNATPQKVGPIAFKMLFTSTERIAAKALRATDPVLEDFWGLLDDPRTLEVDLGLASVQAAVEYTLGAVKANGVADLDVVARKAQILTGIVQ